MRWPKPSSRQLPNTPFWQESRRSLVRAFIHSPARISIGAFLILISVGTLILMLPISAQGERIGFVDALFTSASASCVTGLSVFDISSRLSLFGQIALLMLIQVGGLGIMTMSTLLILVAGKQPTLSNQVLIHDTFTLSKERHPASIIRDVMLYTVVVEACGFVFFWIRFAPDMGLVTGFYSAIFHAISAFCNAGFSLFPNSFEPYRSDLGINLVLAILIISGGIGFLVLAELKHTLFSRRKLHLRRISLHTKLVVSSTVALLLVGTLVILLMEWNHTLAELPVSERFLAAFFQSTTARTAGFNTLSISTLKSQTLFFLIMLMFIGASPGSCGGGIKTTTFAALSLLGISRLRGRTKLLAFKRTIPETSIARAVSILMLSILVVVMGTMLVLMTGVGQAFHPESRALFLDIFFEVVSAFGTVGLSTGITTELTESGKLLLSAIMLIGRIGPLVVALALSRTEPTQFRYAEENIMVG